MFFTNGGADANENAIRMARLHTGRDKVLSTYRSYHGNTGAAIVATGDWRRIPNEFARGHVHFFGPYLYRSEFWATTPEEESERALQHLRRVIEAEGPSSIAAILLETIPGTAGMLPPPGYLAGVRELCDRHGIVLILDEVMAGFGRTGRWFAFDGYDVTPDLITFAKGVNSGYVPAGGVIISDPIAADVRRARVPGRTDVLGPSARDGLDRRDARRHGVRGHRRERPRRRRRGDRPALAELAEKHRVIGEVRGEGVFWALDLVADPETREPLPGRRDGAPQGRARRARPAAVRRGQPHPRGAAVRGHRRGGRQATAIYDEVLGTVAVRRMPRHRAHPRRPGHSTERNETMTDTTTDQATRETARRRGVDHWIDGASVAGASDRTGPVYNPARGVEQKRVRFASTDDVDAAVQAAARAFPAWRDTSIAKRQQVMFKFRELLAAHRRARRDPHERARQGAPPTPPARSRADSRSSSSPARCPATPRASTPRTSRRASTSTPMRQPSASWASSARSTSRPWCRCGSSRSRSRRATPSC